MMTWKKTVEIFNFEYDYLVETLDRDILKLHCKEFAV